MEKFVKFLPWLLFIIITLFFLNEVRIILFPFIAALILSYLFDPIVDKAAANKIPRAITSMLLVGSFYLIILGILLLVTPIIYQETLDFVTHIPEFTKYIDQTLLPKLTKFFYKINPAIAAKVKLYLADATNYLLSLIEEYLKGFWRSGLAFLQVLALIFITPIITFFILTDWPDAKSDILALIPKKYKKNWLSVLDRVDEVVSGYLRGQLTVCLSLACYYGIALTITGLEFGTLIGIATGLMIFVPFIGYSIGLSIAIIVALMHDNVMLNLILVGIVYSIGQVIETNFLTPKLVGDKIGLHPAWIIFAMLSFTTIFGPFGIVIAIPSAAIVAVFIRIILTKYKKAVA